MKGKDTRIRVCIVEAQELFREAYKVSLDALKAIFDLKGAYSSIEGLAKGINNVDVLVLGLKNVSEASIQEIERICSSYPELALVVLLRTYPEEMLKEMLSLRKIARKGGAVLFLRQFLDSSEQLRDIIFAANRGETIFDPYLAKIVFGEEAKFGFLKKLALEQLETLSLMAKGYSDPLIAKILRKDLKTVRRNIRALYRALEREASSAIDKRVAIATLYQQAIS